MTGRNEQRLAAIAERLAVVERLKVMPVQMRERPQWLLWKLEQIAGRNGLSKVPYYVSGSKRHGELGGAEDLARLASFDTVCARFASSFSWAGVGFAILLDSGLVGIDLDHIHDAETGALQPHHLEIIGACDSYTELSPSGQGAHIWVSGLADSFKHDGVGVEVYDRDRWFACTGAHYDGTPLDVRPLKPAALAYLRQVVQESKDKAKAARAQAQAAERAAAPPAPAAGPRSPGQGPAGAGGDDFRLVNDTALGHLDAWVPRVFSSARTWRDGYRVRSKDLGRDMEEDLQLTPDGIMDFGEERGYSPIDLVMKWQPGCSTAKDALHWLAGAMGVTLSAKPRPKLRAVTSHAPGLDHEPNPEDAPAAASGGSGSDKPPRSRRKSPTPPDGVGGNLTRLESSFRLIYGTDAVWDGEQRITMAVKNLRLVFGHDAVKMWLASEKRRMVMQSDMVFEPALDVPEHQVNLFDGLPLVPEPCGEEEVYPMLDLLRHLCSKTAAEFATTDTVMDWVLKWIAYPLQHIGAKMRSALVFHGPQGTGKNLFFDCIRIMYGKYGRMVGQTELDDKFNDWLSAKLLIIGNEVVTRQELFHNKNKLKWIVTEDEIPIRGMHQTVRWESNHAQVVFLSNENMPIAVEKDDRRHLVVYTPIAGDEALYRRVAEFLAAGGAAKFLYYLQHYDLQDFGEHTKPLMTEAKSELIELGLKPAERFVNEWLRGYLPLPLQVCSAEQLYRVFRRWGDMAGERWPVSQAMFTATVQRHVNEGVEKDPQTGERKPPALTYKVVMLKHETGPRKAVRCWLPAGSAPPEGMTEGHWAADAVEAFEQTASRYGRVHFEDGEP